MPLLDMLRPITDATNENANSIEAMAKNWKDTTEATIIAMQAMFKAIRWHRFALIFLFFWPIIIYGVFKYVAI